MYSNKISNYMFHQKDSHGHLLLFNIPFSSRYCTALYSTGLTERYSEVLNEDFSAQHGIRVSTPELRESNKMHFYLRQNL